MSTSVPLSQEEDAGEEDDWTNEFPDNEPVPEENGELPCILELELDTEAEEVLHADKALDTGSLLRPFSLEASRCQSHSLTFLSPLTRLRI